MKILEDYKKIAKELLFEVDDEKIIKYKDEDGESKEMKAGSAKTMPDEHPAKQAYNKMKDDGGDDKEEPSGQKLGGSDYDRDGGDDDDKGYEPRYYDDDAEFEKRYRYEPDAHIRSFNDEEREEIINKMADDAGVSVDDPIELVKIVRGKDEYGNAKLGDIHKHIKDMADKPKDDGDAEKYHGLEDYEKNIAKEADAFIEKHGKFGDGTSLPKGTNFNTEVDDLDYEEVEAFYDNVAKEYAEKYDIDMGAMDDAMNDTISSADTMSDLVNSIKGTAQELVGENVESKKKPFLREQLERFRGLK